jgi:hypothetical protein
MDEHFSDLFARYEVLVPQHGVQPAGRVDLAAAEAAPEFALARSAVLGS